MFGVQQLDFKHLRTLGFYATNAIFAENAWYFRNALVRANYTNLQKGIHETTEYLEAFLRNLLLNEKNELHNRNLHISGLLNEEKVDIGSVLSEKGSDFSEKTMVHIHRLFEKFGFDEVFGRSPEIVDTACRQSGILLSWSHYRTLLQVKDPEARDWYEKEALDNLSANLDANPV